jgi:hypothetical protein
MQEIIAVVQLCCLIGGLGVILVALLIGFRLLGIVRQNEEKFHGIMDTIYQAREPILASLHHAEHILADAKIIAEQSKQASMIVQEKMEKVDIESLNALFTQAGAFARNVQVVNHALSESVLPPITRIAKMSRALQRAVDAFLQRIGR